MKKLIYFLLTVAISIIVSCKTSPPISEVEKTKNDTLILTERVALFGNKDAFNKTSCYFLDENGNNTVDSIITTYVKGSPNWQEVYYNDSTAEIYISNFHIRDLSLRMRYNTYSMLKTKADSLYYNKLSTSLKSVETPTVFNKFLGDWLYFNSFLKETGNKTLTFNDYLQNIKGFNDFEILSGFTSNATLKIMGIITSALLIIGTALGKIVIALYTKPKSPENTG